MEKIIIIDFKEFNKQCVEEGRQPFFLENVKIDIASKEYFKESIRVWEDALKKWWNEQK